MQGRKNSLKPAVRHSIYGKNVMSTDFTPRSTILDISPYVPGKSSAGANQKIIKLSFEGKDATRAADYIRSLIKVTANLRNLVFYL